MQLRRFIRHAKQHPEDGISSTYSNRCVRHVGPSVSEFQRFQMRPSVRPWQVIVKNAGKRKCICLSLYQLFIFFLHEKERRIHMEDTLQPTRSLQHLAPPHFVLFSLFSSYPIFLLCFSPLRTDIVGLHLGHV